MTTTTVSTVAELQTAVSTAKGGDTILLAPGSYERPTFNGPRLSLGPPITIRSADLNSKAVLIGLQLTGCSVMSFVDLGLTTVGYTHDPYFAFRIANSSNIIFSNLDVHGDVSLPAAQATLSGFYVTDGLGIDFYDCTFRSMRSAITANRCDNVEVIGCKFSQMDKGGIECGGTSNLIIDGNVFSDFSVHAGTHSDAIQIYTVGTTTIAHDIQITENLFFRGSGDVAQGIFVQDEVGTLPFHNVTIADNAIIGGMWDSIRLAQNNPVAGKPSFTGQITITGNVAVSWPGLDKEGAGDVAAVAATAFSTTNFIGEIQVLGDLTGCTLTLTGNTAQAYQVGKAGPATPAGNVVSGPVTDQGAGALFEFIKKTLWK